MKKVVDRAVIDAQRRSDAARQRLLETTAELRERLTPRALVSGAIENVSRRTENLLDTAQATARRSPLTTASGVAAFLVAVGLRLWIARRKSSEPDETASGLSG